MIEIEDIHHERHFLDLLCDAVVLAQLSNDAAENDEAQFSLARGSIISSVFSLECAANCCIVRASLTKQYCRTSKIVQCMEKGLLHLLTSNSNSHILHSTVQYKKSVGQKIIKSETIRPYECFRRKESQY